MTKFARLPIIVLSIGALCVGCEEHEPPPPKSSEVPFGAAVETFRSLVPRGSTANSYVNCLSINRQDPPGPVLAALEVRGYDVVPASECTWVIESSGSFHTKTGKRAKFHRLDHFSKQGSVAAEIHGSSGIHGLNASSAIYDLAFNDGQWRVVGVRERRVS